MNTSHIAFAVALGVAVPAGAGAQTSLFPPPLSLCSTTVSLPPPAPGRGGPGAPGGRGAGGAIGRGGPQAEPAAADPPRLVKVKDDVYVIQNVNNTVAEIGPFGGNV